MYFFVVNSVSGNGRGREVWSYVEKRLSKLNVTYQAEFTQRAGHATSIVKSAMRQPGLKAIVAIGGDGTVNEVGSGLIGTNIPMGYIPAGTGNDFAIANRIPFDPYLALDRILEHKVQRIDTADLGDRKMIGFMGIGFDGKVAEMVNRSAQKKWLGRLTYVLEGLKLLRSFEPDQFTLTIDGKSYEYDGAWLVAVTNIPNLGGGMKICPSASIDDGQLDICCVQNLTQGQLLRVIPTVYKGKHTNHPSIRLHRGREITIQSRSPLPIHVDGEVVLQPPLSIKVNPQSLSII